jgi:hypothetical protein
MRLTGKFVKVKADTFTTDSGEKIPYYNAAVVDGDTGESVVVKPPRDEFGDGDIEAMRAACVGLKKGDAVDWLVSVSGGKFGITYRFVRVVPSGAKLG